VTAREAPGGSDVSRNPSLSALVPLGLAILGLLAVGILLAGNSRQDRIAVLMQRCAAAGFTEPQCTFLIALAERADSDEAFRRLLNDAAASAH
jgi:hypothetical protein